MEPPRRRLRPAPRRGGGGGEGGGRRPCIATANGGPAPPRPRRGAAPGGALTAVRSRAAAPPTAVRARLGVPPNHPPRAPSHRRASGAAGGRQSRGTGLRPPCLRLFRPLPWKNGRRFCRLPASLRRQTLPERGGFQRRLILEACETGVKDATGAREEQIIKS